MHPNSFVFKSLPNSPFSVTGPFDVNHIDHSKEKRIKKFSIVCITPLGLYSEF